MNNLHTRLMVTCLILIVIDLTLTYCGVKYLGMVEGSLIMNRAGLIPGTMIILTLFSFITYVLWVMRKSRIAKTASISGLGFMCVIELFAIIHNIFMVMGM